MNAAKQLTTQRVSRINTLLNKMLTANTERSESASSSRHESVDRVHQAPVVVNPGLKRNLFGVSLNHDQLKQDLNSMWKEQLEIQRVKWNFDFESLKPVETSTNDRFKWSKLNLNEQANDATYKSTLADDKENLNSKSSVSDIPQFYKQQRCLKLIDNITPKVQQEDLIKPKPVKSKHTKLQLNQIITFSENRKDTLRSASANSSTKVVSKSTSSAFTAKNEKKSTDNLKQQSLLDMLKQRKKRIQTTSGSKPAKITSEPTATSSTAKTTQLKLK